MGIVPVYGSIVGPGNCILVSVNAVGGFTVAKSTIPPVTSSGPVPVYGDISGPGKYISVILAADGSYVLSKDTLGAGTAVPVYGAAASYPDSIWIRGDSSSLAFSLGIAGGQGPDPNIARIASFIPAFKIAKPLIIANTASGNRNIICTGDSQCGGIGSTAPSNTWPAVLAASLTAAGVPAENDSIMTDSNAFNFATWQTNATKSGGANAVLGNFIGGASCFACVTDTVSEWDFSFPTCDKFELYVPRPGDGSGGVLNVGTDGSNFLGITGTGAGDILKQLKTPSGLVPHVLNLKRTSGLSPQLIGVHAYTVATKKFSVLNLGQSGAKIGNLNSISSGGTDKPGQKDLVAIIAPTLTLVCCHYNDANALTNINTYKTDLTTVLTHAKTLGDVIAILGPQITPAYVPYATQAIYRQAVMDVVNAMGNIGLIDMQPTFVNFVLAKAAGYFSADDVHPSDAGYLKYGQYVASVLLAA